MKEENNQLLDKIAFIALYWGQPIMKTEDGKPTDQWNKLGFIDYTRKKKVYLSLKSLESISDKHAVELVKFMGFNTDDPVAARSIVITVFVMNVNDNIKMSFLQDFSDISAAIDKIREMGYLFRFRGYSADKILELGWAKIKQ